MSEEYEEDYDDVEVIDAEYEDDEEDAPPRKVSRIPANAPRPQDHKPKKKRKKAAHAEAVDGYLSLTVAGVDLKVPIKGKMPVKSAIAFANGDEFGGTSELLGLEQWERFLDVNPTLDDYRELSEAIAEAVGN